MNNSKTVTLIVAALALTATGLIVAPQQSFADKATPAFIPPNCETFVGQPSHSHTLNVLTAGPYLPGGSINVQAGTTHTGTGANRVRIVAMIDNATTFQSDLKILPNPFGIVNDTIHVPNSVTSGQQIDLYACDESPGSLNGVGVTHHVNSAILTVGTIFPLPESALGTIGLVAASLGALGGFLMLTKKGTFGSA